MIYNDLDEDRTDTSICKLESDSMQNKTLWFSVRCQWASLVHSWSLEDGEEIYTQWSLGPGFDLRDKTQTV
jgi:hypothetical protein